MIGTTPTLPWRASLRRTLAVASIVVGAALVISCAETTSDDATPSATSTPTTAPQPVAVGTPPACDQNYAGACIPVYPPDVNCADIPERGFRVVGEDVHDLDSDGNGIACES